MKNKNSHLPLESDSGLWCWLFLEKPGSFSNPLNNHDYQSSDINNDLFWICSIFFFISNWKHWFTNSNHRKWWFLLQSELKHQNMSLAYKKEYIFHFSVLFAFYFPESKLSRNSNHEVNFTAFLKWTSILAMSKKISRLWQRPFLNILVLF